MCRSVPQIVVVSIRDDRVGRRRGSPGPAPRSQLLLAGTVVDECLHDVPPDVAGAPSCPPAFRGSAAGRQVVRGFGPVHGVSTPTRRPAVRQRPHRCGPESPSRNTPTAPDVPMTGRPRHDHVRRRTRDGRLTTFFRRPPAVAVPAAVAGPGERPGVGAAGAARRCSPRPPCSTSGASARPAGRTRFYSAAAQAGSPSWKAFFFGSSRRRQLHHRRQAARVAVGDGAVGAAVRAQLVERSSCPQALMGVATVGVLYADRAALVSARRRPARRRGAGAHPGRRADVPVQQPGRAAGAAADRRRLRHGARGRGRRSTRWLVLPARWSASAS